MEFVGREDEIQELRRIRELSRTNARFTVITGRRRVGKTELVKKALGDEPSISMSPKRRNLSYARNSGRLSKLFSTSRSRGVSKGFRTF